MFYTSLIFTTMNTIATPISPSSRYGFLYGRAPWIEAGVTAGIFTTLLLGSEDDEIAAVNFKAGTQGIDRVKIMINTHESSEPAIRPLCLYTLTPGHDGTNVSRQVLIELVDAETGKELAPPHTTIYGQDTYKPEPGPTELYMLDYVSAPYAVFFGHNLDTNKVYIIINTHMREGDTASATFTPTAHGSEDEFDSFHVEVTSTEEGATVLESLVFGPFTLTNPDSTGVYASTSVNGRPVQKPIGIKSYGNDIRLSAV